MKKMTYAEGIREAMRLKMQEDPNVILFGEDVGKFGGCFQRLRVLGSTAYACTGGNSDNHGKVYFTAKHVSHFGCLIN